MLDINVAQLLKSAVGTTRDFDFEEASPSFGEELQVRAPVRGHARLMRTQRGILVHAEFTTVVEQACGRCLEPVVVPVEGEFEEEWFPSTEILTGLPSPRPDDPDAFLINSHHELDLGEALRQYVTTAIPLHVLCDEACAGLCGQCGKNLNQGPCECAPATTERASPFEVLGALHVVASRDENT